MLIVFVALGIPLWLIGCLLALLLRARREVKRITGSFTCKARIAGEGSLPGLKEDFGRYKLVGHWVHDVLVLHGGSPFLIKATPYGIAGLVAPPTSFGAKLRGIDDPVSIGFRHDSGIVFELVCDTADVERVLGPLAAATPPADSRRVLAPI